MAQVVVRSFSPGERVGLFERRSDFFNPALLGDPVKTGTVDRGGEVRWDGLPASEAYWVAPVDAAVEDQRGVAVTPKDPPAEKPQARPLASAAPGRTTDRRIVEGARGTKNSRPEQRPRPFPRQDQVPADAPQRSSTPFGEATPKADVNEFQPKVPQSEVDEGVPQRSSTVSGEATPVDERGAAPAASQEDVRGSVQQMSATAEGEAEPVPHSPKSDPGRERARQDSSEAKALGESKEKPAEKLTGGRRPRRAS